MTKPEFDEMAALVVSVRRDVEELIAKGAALEAERNELAAHVSAHVDALKQSNAQCGEYLRKNEQLHSELVDVRAALASVSEERDSLKRTLKAWEDAETEPHVRADPDIRMGLISETGPAVFVRIGAPPNDDIADHVVPPVPVVAAAEVPVCTTCHGCGSLLGDCNMNLGYDCMTPMCNRTCTGSQRGGFSPWAGSCKSTTPVRHE